MKSNLVDKTFSRLTVIKDSLRRASNAEIMWDCICVCGKNCQVSTRCLTSGGTKSCGCFKNENLSQLKHGMARKGNPSPEYRSHQSMKKRCYCKTDKGYQNYGGRGITVCSRWLGENGFVNFLEDMGKRPSIGHSLDRFPNNNGNYEKENCRWATKKQQANNRRSNLIITYKGVAKTASEWAAIKNIKVNTLYTRCKRKVSMELIFN